METYEKSHVKEVVTRNFEKKILNHQSQFVANMTIKNSVSLSPFPIIGITLKKYLFSTASLYLQYELSIILYNVN